MGDNLMKRFVIMAGIAVLSTSAMAVDFIGSWNTGGFNGGVSTSMYNGSAVRFTAYKTGGTLPGGLPSEAVTHLNTANPGFFSFCAELGETIGGGTQTHERVEMIGVGTQTWAGGIQQVTFNLSQVNKLSRLWYGALSGAFGAWDNDLAAAFQLAQWEILFDLGTTNLTGGNFSLTGGAGNGRYAATQTLVNYANTLGVGANLILLSDALNSGSPLVQDQITGYISANPPNTVPEPFTMGLGAAAAGVFVRRRLKAKAA